MNINFCNCDDWDKLSKTNPSVFVHDEVYGWVISWLDLSTCNNRIVKSRYGIKIIFCPFCGKKLKSEGSSESK